MSIRYTNLFRFLLVSAVLLLGACSSAHPPPVQTSALPGPSGTPAGEGLVQRDVAPGTETAPVASSTPSRGLITYTVQAGDTLYSIAAAYGLSPETVLWSNYGPLKDNPGLLSLGMELRIPPANGLIIEVQPGDTVDNLARTFKVKPEDIVASPVNGLSSVNQALIPNQVLFVPGGVRETVVWQLPKTVEVRQMPESTAPPAVSGWIADYRPNWIGYLYASGTLILVTPDGLGGTTAQTLPDWYSAYQYKPNDQVVVTQADKTGHISTWIFNPSTQNDFNQALAQWQQTLQVEYQAGPCIVGVKGHDANFAFTGVKAQAWCAALETDNSYHYTRLSTEPARMAIVCEVALDGAQARARDTGMRIIATDICSQLKAMGGGPPPANWNAAKAALKQQRAVETANDALAAALTSLENHVKGLKQDTDFKTVLDRYGELLTQMQVDYQKEQDAGSKALPYCQNQIDAQNASYQVQNGLYGVQNNDYALDALGYTLQIDLSNVAKNITTVQTKWKELQTAVSANTTGTPLPKFTPDDVDAATTTAQAQVDSSTKALNDTKAKAALFDKQAADLTQAAKQFAASIKCP